MEKDFYISKLHHFTMRIPEAELEALAKFYCNILGLHLGPRPPFHSKGIWLYAKDNPLVHLICMNTGETVAPCAPKILPPVDERFSALDHIALSGGDDLKVILNCLNDNCIQYTLTDVPGTGEKQLFFKDPSGTGIEVIFPIKGDAP